MQPLLVVTINVTVFVPAVLYIVDVFWLAEVAGVAPGMFQFQEVMGSPGEETDPSFSVVNVPKHGADGIIWAVGGRGILIVTVCVPVQPLASLTFTV